MTKRNLICIILAAGKGTRMKSALPKVLHQVAGLPMLGHVIRAAQSLNPAKIRVVVGPGQESVVAFAAPHETRLQAEQLGTGDAVRAGLDGLDLAGSDVLVLYGDVPLVTPEILEVMYQRHMGDDHVGATILGMRPENPHGYGRLIVGRDGYVAGIVEQLDATPEQQDINLCNSGMMLLRGEGLANGLAAITNNNAKGEYYLTDLVGIIRASGGLCAHVEGSADDLNGVNDRVQLASAEARLQNKLRDAHMRNGVTLIDPSSVFFATDTVIGNDVTIEPNVFFGAGVQISSNVTIKSFCHLESVTIATGAQIGPFARIREKTVIGNDVHIGNFVELKKSVVGDGTKASHLTYLCDLDIGKNVNIGAGAIFSNYDGVNKHRSSINDHSFVGANATIISPVDVGAGAYVSAGSVITDDVPAEKLAFGRARQVVRDHTDKTKQFSNKKKGK